MNFAAEVNVGRLTGSDEPDAPVRSYLAEIKVSCAECGLPFEFLGLEAGMDTEGAKVSIDGLEARLAITPKGVRPNPFQRMAFGIRSIQ